MKQRLVVVVPCYNESEVFGRTLDVLLALRSRLIERGKIASNSVLCFVDDGSCDDTAQQIERATREHRTTVVGVLLSRNFGHQAALLAGLESMSDRGDWFVTIDADLQDDPQAIEAMVDAAAQGIRVVYGVRRRRDSDSVFKRFSARFYYRLMRFLGVDLVYDHADFRLLDRRALHELMRFGEVNLFLRGLVRRIGFRSQTVYYDRAERQAGQSKYPFFKMLSFAWEGATSFSVRPMRMVLVMGLVSLLVALGIGAWVWIRWVEEEVVRGWSSMVGIVALFGAMQMISIGVIGEYVGKTYKETKKRPRYVVDSMLGDES